MTIEQTIEVPASRRVALEIPPQIPLGKARILVTPVVEPPETDLRKTGEPLLSLRGSCKGLDTMDAYFARKRADKMLEERRNDKGKSGNT